MFCVNIHCGLNSFGDFHQYRSYFAFHSSLSAADIVHVHAFPTHEDLPCARADNITYYNSIRNKIRCKINLLVGCVVIYYRESKIYIMEWQRVQ